jgi:hypothetical protein
MPDGSRYTGQIST